MVAIRRILCVIYQWRILAWLCPIVAHVCLGSLFCLVSSYLLRSLLFFSTTTDYKLIHDNQKDQACQNYADYTPHAHLVVYICPFLGGCQAHLRIHLLIFVVKGGHKISQERVTEDNWRLRVVTCRRNTHPASISLLESQLTGRDFVEILVKLNFEIYTGHERGDLAARCTHATLRITRTVPRNGGGVAQKLTHEGIVVTVRKCNKTSSRVQNGDIHHWLVNVGASESKSTIGCRPPWVVRLHQFEVKNVPKGVIWVSVAPDDHIRGCWAIIEHKSGLCFRNLPLRVQCLHKARSVSSSGRG